MTLRVCLVNLTLNRSDNLYIVAWVNSGGHVQWSRLKFSRFSFNTRKVLAFVARGFVRRAGKQAKIKWVKNKIVRSPSNSRLYCCHPPLTYFVCAPEQIRHATLASKGKAYHSIQPLGGYSSTFYVPRGPTLYPFMYPFLREKGTPFVYLFVKNDIPFIYT